MSMWEPRSSHLYVCTGLRVHGVVTCGCGTVSLSLPGTEWHGACTCPWAVGVCVCARAHGFCDLPFRTFHRVPFSVRPQVCDPVCSLLFRVACEWTCVGVGCLCQGVPFTQALVDSSCGPQ